MKFFRRLLFLSLVFFVAVLVFAYFNNKREVLRPATRIPDNPSTALRVNQITSQPVNQTFSFAVISDIHSDYKNLQKTLDKIRTDKINFIVIVGDLTTLGKLSELKTIKTILDSNQIPYYAVPGNHDLRPDKKWQDVFGPYYQSFQKGNVKFILANNGDGLVGLDQEQESWFDQELADCPKLYCLVFMHMPLNNPTSAHIMGEDNSLVAGQAGLLVDELTKAQVKELFAGHVHYLATYILDGLKTTTDGVIKDHPRFEEVFVYDQPIRIEEKQVWLE